MKGEKVHPAKKLAIFANESAGWYRVGMKVETMNVSLTPEFAAFVRQQVERGLYTTASEVVRDALRLLREHDDLHAKRVQAVRAQIENGWEQLEDGKAVDGAEVMRELKERVKDRSKKRA